MDPFQLQVIAQNPIGKRLDSFQEAFRLTCAKLSISASADAVQQVVKNGEGIELAAKLSLTVLRQQRPDIGSDHHPPRPSSGSVTSVPRWQQHAGWRAWHAVRKTSIGPTGPPSYCSPKNRMLKVLSGRPVRRQFEYDGDFDFSMNRYHVAAENFLKGIVNDPPCTNCRQGVAPEIASLRKFLIAGSFDLHV